MFTSFNRLKKISHEFTRDTDDSNLQSAMRITVMSDGYDVDKILKVEVYDYHNGSYTDVTNIMLRDFEDDLNNKVDEIDWKSEYDCDAISRAMDEAVESYKKDTHYNETLRALGLVK